MRNKRLIVVLLIGVFLAASIVGLRNKNASASNFSNMDVNVAENQINSKIMNEFGKIKIEDNEIYNDKNIYKASDDKFDYKLDGSDGNIVTMVAKDFSNLIKPHNNLNLQQNKKSPSDLLANYVGAEKNCRFTLENSNAKNNSNEAYTNYIFREIAPNGVDTGTGVSLVVSNNNELISLAVHKGNADIAQNTTPKLAKDEAIRIAQNFIYSDNSSVKINYMPEATTYLTVWEDKLVWAVNINKIQVGKDERGYIFYIDALTGQINFNDGYYKVGI